MTVMRLIVAALVGILATVLVQQRPVERCTAHSSITSDNNNSSWNVLYHLGGYGPYVPKAFNLSQGQDDTIEYCKVDQLHMIARHAERYPTVTAGIHMLELYHKLAAIDSPLNGSLAFAQHWSFLTGQPSSDFEQLTTTGPYAGSLTAFKLGVDTKTQYPGLLQTALQDGRRLRLWASDSERVIDTAKYFATALLGLDWHEKADLQVIPETAERGADTLTPGDTCLKYAEDADAFGWSYGSKVVDVFKGTYLATAQKRLLRENPALDLNKDELYVMQELCGFELMSAGESPWCNVFTQDEWLGYSYARDLLHYYRSGPGNPYAAAMGWLWLNTTAGLLKHGPDAGPLFFSFVHDGDIFPVLTALKLFPQASLSQTHIEHDRIWRTSDTVPMGARIIFERLSCATEECWSNELYPNHVYCQPGSNTQHIKIIVNGRHVPLPGCMSGPGLTCPLEDFLNIIAQRGEEVGDFADICGLPSDAPKRITFLHQ